MKKNRIENYSNKGAALLSVIIVMAVVGILAALVLSISYTNYRMKVIDKKSKDNFYTAEAVLDEMCAGIQAEMSLQYKNAYVSIMENYGDDKSSTDMKRDFNTQFVLNMVDAFKNGADADHYDISKLAGYVDARNYPLGVPSVSHVDAKNDLETLEDGFIFRNVVVSYTEGSYVNTITTDVKVTTPELTFARISSMPEIADYCFVAENGLEIEVGNHWSIAGKAYAGEEILLEHGSTLDATDEDTTLLVSKGEVVLNGEAKLLTGKTTSFWAQGINAVYSATADDAINTLSLLGRTYIKDDTTLNGEQNKLILGGQYYGYNNDDTNAKNSSAIIINGANTTIDLSALDSLVLAGTSFVSATSVSSENPEDILMGDSIAVKSNQLAYMVPVECAGVIRNPMTNAQYTELSSVEGWKDKILDTYISGLGRTIGSYGRNEIDVVPIFTPNSGGGSIVYLYLSFADADVASNYFMDYYSKTDGGQKIKDYLAEYVLSFKTNAAMSRIVSEGNYLVPLAINKATYSGNTETAALSAQELASYGSSFTALCKKLVTNMSALTTEELSGTVYSNLIAEDVIEEFFAAHASNSVNSPNVEFTTDIYGNQIATIKSDSGLGGTVVQAIIVKNATGQAYKVTDAYSGILIATGDVDIDGSALVAWDGLVLCNGKLTLGTSAGRTLKNNPDAVGKAMQLVCNIGNTEVVEGSVANSGNYAVLNFFKDGTDFTLGSSSNDPDAKTDVRDCITFENWKSE